MVDKESMSNNIIQLYAFVEQSFSEIELNCKQKNTIPIYLRAFPLVFFFSDP